MKPLKVMVIDDEAAIRQIVAANLLKAGYDVLQAPNGQEAFERLSKGDVQVAICDIRMPDMTGLELRAKVAADEGLAAALQGVRWVALSADNPGAVVRAARAAGFDDYWLKPIDVPVLEDLGGGQRVACHRVHELA